MASERKQLIRSLFDEYVEMYSSRDDQLTTRFSDHFSGYAGSSDVLVTDKEEWIRITRRDFAQTPDRIHLEILDIALQDLATDVVAVTAFFHIHLPEPEP
ncbi:MAG: nuclear transport factor 2 family protein, partial [Aeromonadaceae bacterium]